MYKFIYISYLKTTGILKRTKNSLSNHVLSIFNFLNNAWKLNFMIFTLFICKVFPKVLFLNLKESQINNKHRFVEKNCCENVSNRTGNLKFYIDKTQEDLCSNLWVRWEAYDLTPGLLEPFEQLRRHIPAVISTWLSGPSWKELGSTTTIGTSNTYLCVPKGRGPKFAAGKQLEEGEQPGDALDSPSLASWCPAFLSPARVNKQQIHSLPGWC